MVAAKKKKADESPLVSHARMELELLNEDPEAIEGYLKVVKAFSEMKHSGLSASIAIPIINSLLLFKNITPLTDDENEWAIIDNHITGTSLGLWQSKRQPDAFSTDGGKTYYLLSEGGHFHNQRPIHHSVTKEK